MNQPKDSSGKFRKKSLEYRKVRSIRLTDSTWKRLNEVAESQGMSLGDFFEMVSRTNLLNPYEHIAKLQEQVNKLKRSQKNDTEDN